MTLTLPQYPRQWKIVYSVRQSQLLGGIEENHDLTCQSVNAAHTYFHLKWLSTVCTCMLATDCGRSILNMDIARCFSPSLRNLAVAGSSGMVQYASRAMITVRIPSRMNLYQWISKATTGSWIVVKRTSISSHGGLQLHPSLRSRTQADLKMLPLWTQMQKPWPFAVVHRLACTWSGSDQR